MRIIKFPESQNCIDCGARVPEGWQLCRRCTQLEMLQDRVAELNREVDTLTDQLESMVLIMERVVKWTNSKQIKSLLTEVIERGWDLLIRRAA